jgi:hypothetical protein
VARYGAWTGPRTGAVHVQCRLRGEARRGATWRDEASTRQRQRQRQRQSARRDETRRGSCLRRRIRIEAERIYRVWTLHLHLSLRGGRSTGLICTYRVHTKHIRAVAMQCADMLYTEKCENHGVLQLSSMSQYSFSFLGSSRFDLGSVMFHNGHSHEYAYGGSLQVPVRERALTLTLALALAFLRKDPITT